MTEHPSAKALGYFHSVRYADLKRDFCSKAAQNVPVGTQCLEKPHALCGDNERKSPNYKHLAASLFATGAMTQLRSFREPIEGFLRQTWQLRILGPRSFAIVIAFYFDRAAHLI